MKDQDRPGHVFNMDGAGAGEPVVRGWGRRTGNAAFDTMTAWRGAESPEKSYALGAAELRFMPGDGTRCHHLRVHFCATKRAWKGCRCMLPSCSAACTSWLCCSLQSRFSVSCVAPLLLPLLQTAAPPPALLRTVPPSAAWRSWASR